MKYEPLTVSPARTDDDLHQILALQRANLRSAVDEETVRSQGFVTVQHDLPLLQLFAETAPQIVAKAAGEVVGYALVMPPTLRSAIPMLVPLFELLDTLDFAGRPLREQRFFVNGQVCVAEKYRGTGLFGRLLEGYREALCGRFEVCATEISVANPRSLRAHAKVGFRVIHHYRDATDEWDIVAWQMGCAS